MISKKTIAKVLASVALRRGLRLVAILTGRRELTGEIADRLFNDGHVRPWGRVDPDGSLRRNAEVFHQSPLDVTKMKLDRSCADVELGCHVVSEPPEARKRLAGCGVQYGSEDPFVLVRQLCQEMNKLFLKIGFRGCVYFLLYRLGMEGNARDCFNLFAKRAANECRGRRLCHLDERPG